MPSATEVNYPDATAPKIAEPSRTASDSFGNTILH